MTGRRVDPPGTTPWDRWAGAKIGGFTGAIASAIPAVWIDPYPFGLVIAIAALGAVIGYSIERSKQRR